MRFKTFLQEARGRRRIKSEADLAKVTGDDNPKEKDSDKKKDTSVVTLNPEADDMVIEDSDQRVITPAMRDKLISLGYPPEAIRVMTGTQAQEAINASKDD